MIKQLLGIIFLLSFSSQAFLDHIEVCKNIKDSLNNVILVFKEMTANDRATLFKYSFRQVMYKILETVEFEDEEEQVSISNLIDENRNLHEIKKAWDGYDQKEIIAVSIKTNEQMNISRTESNKKTLEFNNYIILLEKKKAEIKTLVTTLKTDDNDFNLKTEKLHRIIDLKIMVKNTKAYDENFDFEFSEIEELFPNEDSTIKSLIKQFKLKQENYKVVFNIWNVATKADKDFKLAKNSTIKKNLENLKDNISSLTDDLNDIKKKIKKEIKISISIIKNQIMANENYINYLRKLNEAKLLIQKITRISLVFNDFKVTQNKNALTLQSLSNYLTRIHKSDLITMETNLVNLNKVKAMVTRNVKPNMVENAMLQTNIETFFFDNTTRLPEIEERYKDLNEKWISMNKLIVNENKLDTIFGNLIAELQGGATPLDGFNKCFSPLELSVYFYYMSMMQVIVSKASFYEAFITRIPESDQLIITKQIFYDLESEPLIDNEMLNFYTGEFAPGGIKKSTNNFALITNHELDIIFEKQISEKSMIVRFIGKVLHYAGISATKIITLLANVSVNVICKIIIGSLLTVLAITFAPIILTVLVAAFLAELVVLLGKWILGKIQNSHVIMYQFNKGIAGISSYFNRKKHESLDFEEILKENDNEEYKLQVKSRTKSQSNKAISRVLHFKKRFEDIMTLYTTDTDVENLVII